MAARAFARLLLGFLLLVPAGQGADEAPLEYQVKAAFLLNFTKFVEWPSNAFPENGSPIAICIVGKDPFGRALDEIVQGETVNGRRVVVRRISQPPAPQTCQVAFMEAQTIGKLGPGVLTVGEGQDFIRNGGMIGFVIDKQRVRFDINLAAAENAGLKLSSRLLNVARSVEGGGR